MKHNVENWRTGEIAKVGIPLNRGEVVEEGDHRLQEFLLFRDGARRAKLRAIKASAAVAGLMRARLQLTSVTQTGLLYFLPMSAM